MLLIYNTSILEYNSSYWAKNIKNEIDYWFFSSHEAWSTNHFNFVKNNNFFIYFQVISYLENRLYRVQCLTSHRHLNEKMKSELCRIFSIVHYEIALWRMKILHSWSESALKLWINLSFISLLEYDFLWRQNLSLWLLSTFKKIWNELAVVIYEFVEKASYCVKNIINGMNW